MKNKKNKNKNKKPLNRSIVFLFMNLNYVKQMEEHISRYSIIYGGTFKEKCKRLAILSKEYQLTKAAEIKLIMTYIFKKFSLLLIKLKNVLY